MLFLARRDWYNPATTGGDNTMWENARHLASVGYYVALVAASFSGAAKRERRERLDGIRVVSLGGIHSLWLTMTFVRYMRCWRGRFDVVVAEGFGARAFLALPPLRQGTHHHGVAPDPSRPVCRLVSEAHEWSSQSPRVDDGLVHRNTLVRAGTDEWRRPFPRIGFKPENVFLVPVSIRDEWAFGAASPRPQYGPSRLLFQCSGIWQCDQGA